MYFRHSPEIWRDFPALIPGVLVAGGLHKDISVEARIEAFHSVSGERLSTASESEFPEIRAWRRAFSRMGHKPTQY